MHVGYHTAQSLHIVVWIRKSAQKMLEQSKTTPIQRIKPKERMHVIRKAAIFADTSASGPPLLNLLRRGY
ncbi:hypothetical protein Mapa_002714 [Marchantia paleacea]|nr:hypothetical protein Mapa_002714 [Marchantia paleacea]